MALKRKVALSGDKPCEVSLSNPDFYLLGDNDLTLVIEFSGFELCSDGNLTTEDFKDGILTSEINGITKKIVVDVENYDKKRTKRYEAKDAKLEENKLVFSFPFEQKFIEGAKKFEFQIGLLEETETKTENKPGDTEAEDTEVVTYTASYTSDYLTLGIATINIKPGIYENHIPDEEELTEDERKELEENLGQLQIKEECSCKFVKIKVEKNGFLEIIDCSDENCDLEIINGIEVKVNFANGLKAATVSTVSSFARYFASLKAVNNSSLSFRIFNSQQIKGIVYNEIKEEDEVKVLMEVGVVNLHELPEGMEIHILYMS